MSAHEDRVDGWQPEFRRAYDEDARNASRQPFDEYWKWVKAFMVTGGAGQRGWLEQGEAVLQRVTHAATAADLRARVEAVGRIIAAEWAKDSKHRRIHSTLLQGTPNLYDWGRRLQRAAGEDGGDGAAIGRAIDAIEREVDRALRR